MKLVWKNCIPFSTYFCKSGIISIVHFLIHSVVTKLFVNRKNVLGNISFYVILLLQASKKQKLFLMSWCPDTAKVKKKMLYSSSFDALKKSLVGVQKYIQATDLSEASEEAVEEKLRATDRN